MLGSGRFFVVDGGDYLVGQFRGNVCKAVIGASVVLGFFQDFFHGCATSHEIAVHTYISAPENLDHCGLRPPAITGAAG